MYHIFEKLDDYHLINSFYKILKQWLKIFWRSTATENTTFLSNSCPQEKSERNGLSREKKRRERILNFFLAGCSSEWEYRNWAWGQRDGLKKWRGYSERRVQRGLLRGEVLRQKPFRRVGTFLTVTLFNMMRQLCDWKTFGSLRVEELTISKGIVM